MLTCKRFHRYCLVMADWETKVTRHEQASQYKFIICCKLECGVNLLPRKLLLFNTLFEKTVYDVLCVLLHSPHTFLTEIAS
jgi:hypothetical protein